VFKIKILVYHVIKCMHGRSGLRLSKRKTELLETRRQIVNVIFKSIIIKVSVSELVNK